LTLAGNRSVPRNLTGLGLRTHYFTLRFIRAGTESENRKERNQTDWNVDFHALKIEKNSAGASPRSLNLE
jgi:hypothetical protein